MKAHDVTVSTCVMLSLTQRIAVSHAAEIETAKTISDRHFSRIFYVTNKEMISRFLRYETILKDGLLEVAGRLHVSNIFMVKRNPQAPHAHTSGVWNTDTVTVGEQNEEKIQMLDTTGSTRFFHS